MTITEQLRKAIADSGETHYRIGKETSIAPSVLDRFVNRETAHLRGETADKLADYLGLELCRKKRRTAPKQASKTTAPSRKWTARK